MKISDKDLSSLADTTKETSTKITEAIDDNNLIEEKEKREREIQERKIKEEHVVKEECPQKAIKEAAREICHLVKNLSNSTLKAVKDKYSLPQFMNVAQFCEQQ